MMMADSVEAACRSLSDPTHERLEALVEVIFKARAEDGQLNDTDLTFKDLTRIKETFLAMLLGIYHLRVKYPGQGESEGDAEPVQVLSEQPILDATRLIDAKEQAENGSDGDRREELPLEDVESPPPGSDEPRKG